MFTLHILFLILLSLSDSQYRLSRYATTHPNYFSFMCLSTYRESVSRSLPFTIPFGGAPNFSVVPKLCASYSRESPGEDIAILVLKSSSVLVYVSPLQMQLLPLPIDSSITMLLQILLKLLTHVFAKTHFISICSRKYNFALLCTIDNLNGLS